MPTTGREQPPPGYPKGGPPEKQRCCPRYRKKRDRGFIEGCIAALCCCWLCDVCFD